MTDISSFQLLRQTPRSDLQTVTQTSPSLTAACASLSHKARTQTEQNRDRPIRAQKTLGKPEALTRCPNWYTKLSKPPLFVCRTGTLRLASATARHKGGPGGGPVARCNSSKAGVEENPRAFPYLVPRKESVCSPPRRSRLKSRFVCFSIDGS